MAARTKAEIVKEAQAVVKDFGISIIDAGNAGATGADASKPSMTWQQAMLRLQLLQIELLANIRQAENA